MDWKSIIIHQGIYLWGFIIIKNDSIYTWHNYYQFKSLAIIGNWRLNNYQLFYIAAGVKVDLNTVATKLLAIRTDVLEAVNHIVFLPDKIMLEMLNFVLPEVQVHWWVLQPPTCGNSHRFPNSINLFPHCSFSLSSLSIKPTC